MNFITAITLTITIAWLMCSAIAGALVNNHRGQVQTDATHLDGASAGNPSLESKRESLVENDFGGGYLNPAKVIRLELDRKIDPIHVISPSTPHLDTTTTVRPSQGQIPRPAIVSRQGRNQRTGG